MSRSDGVGVLAAAIRESDTLYLAIDYAAYCVGIPKAAREDLAAQLAAFVGPIVRWREIRKILASAPSDRREGGTT